MSAIASDLQRVRQLEEFLRAGPRSAAEAVNALGWSQPTFSRTIQAGSASVVAFRVPGRRTPLYGLLRQLPGALNPRQRIYRVSDAGAVEPFADVEFLSGGATVERIDSRVTYYEGLPPYMAFAAPSGFLGRQVARIVSSQMQLPESLKDWADDHRVAYLFTRGMNLSGNLIYGDASLQAEMEFRRAPVAPAADKLALYVDLANQLKTAAYGSSAGGEQPKFLALAQDAGHVIVKFAKKGTRMAELLPLEHLSLRSLELVDVPAAKSRILTRGDYVFLEVERFDRIGQHGRVGMLSAGSIDDEFFGLRDTWPEFAARCEQRKYLVPADARRIDVMAAFSELIGNSDRHFENVSVLLGEDAEYSGVAPAYDILPMRYGTIGGGLDPDLVPIEPRVGTIGANPQVWDRAARAARHFWSQVMAGRLDAPISKGFRDLAAKNLAVVEEFVAPLLPATPLDKPPARTTAQRSGRRPR